MTEELSSTFALIAAVPLLTFMLRHSDVPDDDCPAMPAVVVDALLAPAAGDAVQLYDDGRRDLKSEALSVAHLMTHKPKNRWCIACQKAKMQYRAHRNKGGVLDADIKKFGDSITADHLIAQNELSRGITGDRDALVIKDRATGWLACYPVPDKSADEAYAKIIELSWDAEVPVHVDRRIGGVVPCRC